LKAVVVTGERLDAEVRERIESAFGAKVCQEYGCTEAGPIAHECPEGSLHVNEENIVLECARCRRRFTPAESCCDRGEVLVTELNNRVMPVIRYFMSDRVRVEPGFCGCGRQTLRIAAVIGRELDTLLLKDGSVLSGTFFDYLPKYVASEIVEMQFVQRVPGCVEVIFVRGPGFQKSTLIRFAAKIAEGAGTALEVVFKEVNAIPREPSGKIRLVRRIIIDEGAQGN
jgi:phenylacetate-CoA ligase